VVGGSLAIHPGLRQTSALCTQSFSVLALERKEENLNPTGFLVGEASEFSVSEGRTYRGLFERRDGRSSGTV